MMLPRCASSAGVLCSLIAFWNRNCTALALSGPGSFSSSIRGHSGISPALASDAAELPAARIQVSMLTVKAPALESQPQQQQEGIVVDRTIGISLGRVERHPGLLGSSFGKLDVGNLPFASVVATVGEGSLCLSWLLPALVVIVAGLVYGRGASWSSFSASESSESEAEPASSQDVLEKVEDAENGEGHVAREPSAALDLVSTQDPVAMAEFFATSAGQKLVSEQYGCEYGSTPKSEVIEYGAAIARLSGVMLDCEATSDTSDLEHTMDAKDSDASSLNNSPLTSFKDPDAMSDASTADGVSDGCRADSDQEALMLELY